MFTKEFLDSFLLDCIENAKQQGYKNAYEWFIHQLLYASEAGI